MKVVVAGGGVGGLTAALALALFGAEVRVLERASAFAEVGAGLQLSPNATRRLFALGLEAPLRRAAFAPLAAEIRDSRGGALLYATELGPTAEARWGAPYLQLHRADLLAILLDACAAAGVSLLPGRPLEGFEATQDGVTVRAGGETLACDLLVGVDGVRSAVRAALLGPEPARFTGKVAWRGLVEAERLAPGLIAPAATVWTGRGAHFVHYYVKGGRLVNFAGFAAGSRGGPDFWAERARPGEIASIFVGWPEPVQALLSALADQGECGWRFAVHDRPIRPGWARGRVALLGDAAHPMAPYLAQGAGMAVEDAEALARHLAGGASVEAALAAYADERLVRVRRVQSWAERNGRVFHLPAAARRLAFALARRGWAGGDLDWLYGG